MYKRREEKQTKPDKVKHIKVDTEKVRWGESYTNKKQKKERKEKSFTMQCNSCRDPGCTTERMQTD